MLSSSYSPFVALGLARAAAEAYEPSAAANVLKVISGEVGEVVVSQFDADSVAVSFRGTRPLHLDDWWHDGEAWGKRVVLAGRACIVHFGFWSALDDVHDELDEALLHVPRHRLFVTGHSLGGAMAAIYAAGRDDVTGLYTFGQPRTGDAAFVGIFECRDYVRIVNDRDVVPHVPLTYRHGGRLAWIDHAGNLTWPADDPFQPDLFENVQDHEISHYISLLERIAA